ncbi:hypothetical protein D9619_001660 [Psilocybe cf. subviscida]|uniref:Uncharacterized protein n=1 Tax=Psilocybe cf. subviscida TaxID=2480587 RepID=A0A8H5BDC0_9AGAR|nr:hypothetical protein D9619_001660 [Psilocybe cf. subviscida]
MKLRSLLLSLASFSLAVAADIYLEDPQDGSDPYLKYRPPFVRSLPVQIMLTGVVLTLVAVLFIHLMFTAQYHWPLAPVNYILQLSGVTTLLISLIATIHVVLSAAFTESEGWPYMLSYIAVNVPPLDIDLNDENEGWTPVERATWLVMNACTSGLIQITHIQFLTLLYPSKLESRLIFALLGPLAVVAAIMQLLSMSTSETVNRLSLDIRNVCNASLSLLFTLALFIWGVFVNRKQAWRTDGGTAVFGAAALSLAVISTALNVLYVHKEQEFAWLPGLMWAVVLWQSFLGWWWWVGAGSGGGYTEEESMEDKLRREAKRERRKKEAKERRQETKLRAQKVWKGVAGAFVPSSSVSTTLSHGDLRSRASVMGIPPDSTYASPSSTGSTRNRGGGNRRRPLSRDSSETLTGSTTQNTRDSTLPHFLPLVVHRWYSSLRHAHNAAARVQAAERSERVERMRDRARDDSAGAARRAQDGDGYFRGSTFGWWNAQGTWGRRRDGNQRRGTVTSPGSDKDSDRSRSGSRSKSSSRGRRGPRKEARSDPDDIYVSEEDARQPSRQQQREGSQHQDRSIELQTFPRHRDEGAEETASSPTMSRQDTSVGNTLPRPVTNNSSTSIWWWGPLKRWRLQDSTIY